MDEAKNLSDTQAFRGLILERIEHVHDCIESIKGTVTTNSNKIIVLETQVAILLKVSWLLFGSCVVVIVGSVLKIAIK